jgi:hypothetical protein
MDKSERENRRGNQEWTIQKERKPKGQYIIDDSEREKNEGATKNEQLREREPKLQSIIDNLERENRRGNQEWTKQTKKTEVAIKNG